MDKQFTASEVRAAIAGFSGYSATHHGIGGNLIAMLNAFADLLETREKAVPVAVVKDSDALYTGWLSWTGEPAPPETKLYTHPAPSDAERLAEALRVTDEMVERACKKYAFREDGAVFPDAYSDEEVLAERVLMREFLEHVLSSAHSAQAQPPAASVTDAMVERAFDKLLADGLDDLDRPKIEGMRAALEAALAAQENPNG